MLPVAGTVLSIMETAASVLAMRQQATAKVLMTFKLIVNNSREDYLPA